MPEVRTPNLGGYINTDNFGNIILSSDIVSSVGIKDSGDVRVNPAKEDGNLSSIKTNTDKLDANLSTVAKDSTALLIKAKTDNLDVALSTVSKDATLTGGNQVTKIKNKAGTTVNPSTEDTLLLVKAKTDNLDVALSLISREATVTNGNQKSQIVDGSGNVIASLGNSLSTISAAEINSHQGKSFTVVRTGTVGTTETNILYLANPAGSGKTFKIRRIDYIGASAANDVTWIAYVKNTVGTLGGTAQIPENKTVGSTVTSVASVRVGTITGVTRSASIIDSAFCNHYGFTHIARYPQQPNFSLLPGNNVVFTADATATNTVYILQVDWDEE